MSFQDLNFATIGWVGLAMLMLWLISLLRSDASIVDIFWGLGFVLVTIAAATPDASEVRQRLAGALVTIWALRLATHLYLRNRGAGEDPRYKAMRRRWGAGFPIISLFTVFALQGVLMWIVSLPVQAAVGSPAPAELTALDIAGIVLWVVGLMFETVGDIQLSRFKSDAANAGKVMDRGLWRFTRHPNYFGDCVVWWGLGLIGLATGAWWSLIGPLAMTILLLRVSGVALLERRMKRTRPDYADYAARTSAFVPLPPKKAN